jgi:PAS domain S-box-containing protein
MWGRSSRPLAGYVLAVGVTALAALLRWMLDPILGPTGNYQTFLISVVLVATVWGCGPGLWAVLLGAVAGTWLFAVQHGHAGPWVDDLVRLLVYLVVGVTVSLLAGRLRDQHHRVDQQLQLLAVTLASIGDAVIVTDPQCRVAFLNGNAEHLTGWTSDEAAAQPLPSVFRIINGQTGQPVLAPAVVARGQNTTLGSAEHTELVAKDGRRIPIEGSAGTIWGADGTVQGMVLVLRDSSEQRRSQESLRDAAELRQMALEAAELGTWEYNVENRQVFADDRAHAMFDMTPQELDWQQLLERIHPEDRHRVDEAVQEALKPQSGGRYAVEYRILWPDGTVRWIAGRGQVFFREEHAQRRPIRFIGTVADITGRKEAEESLQRRNQGLRLLSQAAAELLAAEDPDRMIQDLFARVGAFLEAEVFFNFILDDSDPARPLRLDAAGGIDAATRAAFSRLAWARRCAV